MRENSLFLHPQKPHRKALIPLRDKERLEPVIHEYFMNTKTFEDIKDHPFIRCRLYDENGQLLFFNPKSSEPNLRLQLDYEDTQKLLETFYPDKLANKRVMLVPRNVFHHFIETFAGKLAQKLAGQDEQGGTMRIYSYIIAGTKEGYGASTHTTSFCVATKGEKTFFYGLDAALSQTGKSDLESFAYYFSRLNGVNPANIQMAHRRIKYQKDQNFCAVYSIIDAIESEKDFDKTVSKMKKCILWDDFRRSLGADILRVLRQNVKNQEDKEKVFIKMIYLNCTKRIFENRLDSVSKQRVSVLAEEALAHFKEFTKEEEWFEACLNKKKKEARSGREITSQELELLERIHTEFFKKLTDQTIELTNEVRTNIGILLSGHIPKNLSNLLSKGVGTNDGLAGLHFG